jgi:hypothetical protein
VQLAVEALATAFLPSAARFDETVFHANPAEPGARLTTKAGFSICS